MPKTSEEGKPKKGHRIHTHWRVTVIYTDKEISGRVFTNREKAEKFAARQQRSPVVKTTTIEQVH
jgi:hypothetical protein